MKGYIALSTVLILASVTIAISTTVALLSIGEAQSSLVLNKGEDNLNFVEGCVEDYLLKIRANPAFSGGSVTRPEGTCTITINSGNPNWDIVVTSQTANYQRKIQAKFTRGGSGLTLTSWKEI